MANNELYCEICQVQSTNLSAHYDHIHSRRHQKATGIVHKIERSTLAQVLAKLEELKQEHLEIMSGNNGEPAHQHISFTERLEQESKNRREERKRKKMTIKEDPVLEHVEPGMLDSGFDFGSFSSSKRN
ncbi:U4/U6.U5 snRNP associated protein [Mitosporidium daphniae]|uniref:U1-type domain-containing protein n=1 Tax=Mitosporidium daphniae TaxID=1485682 RepID=A0A098VRE5_9MICR|nr:uncharacterized protein DI09_78p70 [Mitosporidium daphniae]KGG50301.1 hypothetical protein DI09_78p70 [Mitosporidium daphniae]|eukprot:XP_013236744.1 uncharacterized protein DI09_78p70 [Mitosporidium daphniae]